MGNQSQLCVVRHIIICLVKYSKYEPIHWFPTTFSGNRYIDFSKKSSDLGNYASFYVDHGNIGGMEIADTAKFSSTFNKSKQRTIGYSTSPNNVAHCRCARTKNNMAKNTSPAFFCVALKQLHC